MSSNTHRNKPRHWRGLAIATVTLMLAAGCNNENNTLELTPTNTPKEIFWEAFYAGEYERLPEIIERLSGAYFEDPNNAETALLLAHSHFWKAGESARLTNPPPNIFDNFIIAKRYFDKAILLNPGDYRVHGWSGGTEFTLGMLHRVPDWMEKGYQEMVASIDMYPEFNYFSAGFPTAALPPTDPLFLQGIEFMWLGIDVCLGEAIDRNNPDYTSYMELEVREGPKRVCWNNEKTPHGFEGFFFGFGDMLVKNGQPDIAKIMYANAKLSPDYEQWGFQKQLDERIASADSRALAYQSPDPTQHPPTLINMPYACGSCHAKGEKQP